MTIPGTRLNARAAMLALLILTLSGCQTLDSAGRLGGTLLGGAGGGFAGSKFGQGTGRLAATAGGTLLGAIVGGFFGDTMIDQPRRNSRNIRSIQQSHPTVYGSPTPTYLPMPYPTQPSAPQLQLSPSTCTIKNNYVVCN
jgi:uncharacterized protein YcfJ